MTQLIKNASQKPNGKGPLKAWHWVQALMQNALGNWDSCGEKKRKEKKSEDLNSSPLAVITCQIRENQF